MATNAGMHVKSNSCRFLDAFNKIERYLRRVTRETSRVPFYTLIDKASKSSSVAGNFSTDLREFADLRNAIVHESTNGHVIAEPNEACVRRIERIASVLHSPPKVVPLFQKDVSTLSPNNSVAEAVHIMLQKSFSQIPIYTDKEFKALLTTNTVTRWLGSSIEEDIFILSETTIKNILK